MLRKSFAVKKPIASVRIYATGVGFYELYLNGNLVGDAVPSPGWTRYHTRVQYEVYDVTDFLRLGPNGLGMVLGYGWYKGIVGWNLDGHHYGDTWAAWLQLHVRYEDGTEDVVVSDTSWKGAARVFYGRSRGLPASRRAVGVDRGRAGFHLDRAIQL